MRQGIGGHENARPLHDAGRNLGAALVDIESEIDDLRDAFASKRSREKLYLLAALVVVCAVFVPFSLNWVIVAGVIVLLAYGVVSVLAERELHRLEDEARARISSRRR